MAVPLQPLMPVNYLAVSCRKHMSHTFASSQEAWKYSGAEVVGSINGPVHGIVGKSEMGVRQHVRKAVDSMSSVVVRGCIQLPGLCTLPKTCFFLGLSLDTGQSTLTYVCA